MYGFEVSSYRRLRPLDRLFTQRTGPEIGGEVVTGKLFPVAHHGDAVALQYVVREGAEGIELLADEAVVVGRLVPGQRRAEVG